MADIKYEGIGFNGDWVKEQTLADFQAHEAHHGLSEAQLKEVWQLARGTKDVEDVSKGTVDAPIESASTASTGPAKKK
jgi:hypothetical protein